MDIKGKCDFVVEECDGGFLVKVHTLFGKSPIGGRLLRGSPISEIALRPLHKTMSDAMKAAELWVRYRDEHLRGSMEFHREKKRSNKWK